MRARLRSWLAPKFRRQRARAVAADAVQADLHSARISPGDIIGHLMDEIVATHNERYHPGFGCAENTRGQCWDRFGGERASGPLGEYWRMP